MSSCNRVGVILRSNCRWLKGQRRWVGLLAAVIWAFQLWGCGTKTPPLDANEVAARNRLQALGVQYARYLNLHNGQLPPNEPALKQFIAAQGKTFLQERRIDSIDSLFASSRDGEPLVVSYGAGKLVRGFKADPMVAHENSGVDGRRLAVFPSGAVIELDEEMFSKLSVARGAEETPASNEPIEGGNTVEK